MYDIFFSIDDYADIALFTTINSIIKNCTNIQLIKFNILVSKNKDLYNKNINERFKDINFEIKEFNETTYKKEYNFLLNYLNMVNPGSFKVHTNIMNFARIFLPLIFPNTGKCLYLDTDIIVQTDILELFKENIDDNNQCAAVLKRPQDIHFRYPEYITEINFKKKKIYNGFNTGVYLFDSRIWRKNNYTEKCIKILKLQLEKNIMQYGTQPLINLIFYDKTVNIDERWNVAGAGWDSGVTEELLKDAYIIHWSGRQKPWIEDGLWKFFWNKYKI